MRSDDEVRAAIDSAEAVQPAVEPAGDFGRFNRFGRNINPDSPWPDPLAPEAFHGLAGEVVRRIEPHTEADPAALLLQFLVAFGNAIGRGPYRQIEGDHHGPNEFAVIVGDTSKGRKGTSLSRIRDLMSGIDLDWAEGRIKSGLSSGEGLIWQVRDPITTRQPVKQKGKVVEYQDVESDPGEADKRLLIVESEFATVLRRMDRQGSSLSAVIRDAWDRGDLSTLTKNSPAKATGALVSIIAHCTIGELQRYLDRTEAGNGFANRFLFACAKRSKELPEGGGRVDWQDMPQRLQEALQRAGLIGEVGLTDEARQVWRQVYGSLSAGGPGLLGAVTSRAEAHVQRLALIYALLDRQAFIDVQHLLAALAVWTYCEASARHIFGGSLGDPMADAILTALRQAPSGLSRTQIRDLFGRHGSASELTRSLTSLLAQGLARYEQQSTGGRPTELWFAV